MSKELHKVTPVLLDTVWEYNLYLYYTFGLK